MPRRRKSEKKEEEGGVFGFFSSTTPRDSHSSESPSDSQDQQDAPSASEDEGRRRRRRSSRRPENRTTSTKGGFWSSAMSMVGLASDEERFSDPYAETDSQASVSDVDVRRRTDDASSYDSRGSGMDLSDDSVMKDTRVSSNKAIGQHLAMITSRVKEKKGWLDAADQVVEARQKQKLNAVQLALLNAQSHMKQADEIQAAEAAGVSVQHAKWGDMVTKVDESESKKQLEHLGAEVRDGVIVRKVSSMIKGKASSKGTPDARQGSGSGSQEAETPASSFDESPRGRGSGDDDHHSGSDSEGHKDGGQGQKGRRRRRRKKKGGAKTEVDEDGNEVKKSKISVADGPKPALEIVKEAEMKKVDPSSVKGTAPDKEGEFEDELAMLYLERWDLRVTEAEYVLEFEKSNDEYKEDTLKRICGSLQRIGLVLEFFTGTVGDKVYAKVAAPMSLLQWWATRTRLQVKLRPIGYFLSNRSLQTPSSSFIGRKFGNHNDGEDSKLAADGDEDDFAHRDPGSAPYDKDKRHLFEDFRASQRQQLILSLMTSSKKEGGAGINFARELRINNGFLQMFPMHTEEERQPLVKGWGTSWFRRQPLDGIRGYFGERVTLYFAFLGFYSRWLIIPGIIGTFCFVWGLATGKADHIFTPVYALLLAFWVTIFLEFWKRYNSSLSWRWNMLNYQRVEETRPAFKGDPTPGFYTAQGFVRLNEEDLRGVDMDKINHEQFASPVKQAFKFMASYALISTLVGIALVASVMLLVLRIILGESIATNTYDINGQQVVLVWGHVLTGAVSGSWISLSNKAYAWLAEWLTQYENHRTVSEHENHLAIKMFVFQFINSYFSLFYIAFLKSDFVIFGKQDSCSPDCITELTYQLGSLFIARQITQMLLQVILPYAQLKWTRWRVDAALHRRFGRQIPALQAEEEQALLLPHETLIHEYVDVVISYGYITMFAASFPLSSALALFTNFIEIRIDANRMLRWTQRPIYNGARDIGVFYNILQLVGIVSVVTNALVIGVVSKDLYSTLGVTLSEAGRVWAVVIAEHVIFLGKALLMMVIPDQPKSVRDGIAIQAFHQNLLMHDDDIVEDWEVDTTKVTIDLPHLTPPV